MNQSSRLELLKGGDPYQTRYSAMYGEFLFQGIHTCRMPLLSAGGLSYCWRVTSPFTKKISKRPYASLETIGWGWRTEGREGEKVLNLFNPINFMSICTCFNLKAFCCLIRNRGKSLATPSASTKSCRTREWQLGALQALETRKRCPAFMFICVVERRFMAHSLFSGNIGDKWHTRDGQN